MWDYLRLNVTSSVFRYSDQDRKEVKKEFPYVGLNLIQERRKMDDRQCWTLQWLKLRKKAVARTSLRCMDRKERILVTEVRRISWICKSSMMRS